MSGYPPKCWRCHDSSTPHSYIDHPASMAAGKAIRVDGPCPSCTPPDPAASCTVPNPGDD